MKHRALFSSKDKSKKLKCRLLQFLFGAKRVKELSELFPLEEYSFIFIPGTVIGMGCHRAPDRLGIQMIFLIS